MRHPDGIHCIVCPSGHGSRIEGTIIITQEHDQAYNVPAPTQFGFEGPETLGKVGRILNGDYERTNPLGILRKRLGLAQGWIKRHCLEG